jgi:aspartyl-tRNA(Asn)/glutamyl-tRNA(Gln) amidotransferase subunit C
MSSIDKRALEHLAKLARIELDQKEEEKLLRDLGKILNHFKELRTVDTSNIAPLTGGGELKNVFRDDESGENTNQRAGIEQFPETKEGFLKTPPVFEQ